MSLFGLRLRSVGGLACLVVAAGLLGSCGAEGRDGEPESFAPVGQVQLAVKDCGYGDPGAPDFSLEDSNPSSSSFGEVLSLSDFAGRVAVIYFAHAT